MSLPDTVPAYEPRAQSATTGGWTYEQLYFSGDEFFNALLQDVASAQHSIDLEAYIFSSDSLGERVATALLEAANRGVRVRIMVDGIGSAGWVFHYGARFERAGVACTVFHALGWERPIGKRAEHGGFISRVIDFVRRMNRRTHRKIVIVDGNRAWLGGMNIWNVQLRSVLGEKAWRDTGVCVEGPPVADLVDSYEYHWLPKRKRILWRIRRRQRGERLFQSPWVLLNSLRRRRIRNYRSLVRRISRSHKRVWITCSYFVPPGMLLRALRRVSRNGADVRILVPKKSDFFFMPWVMDAFYSGLLDSGARIFRYCPSVLHAKTMIVDDWAIVGSSNLNHRSWRHDLEVDVVLCSEQAKNELCEQFLRDLTFADEPRRAEYRRSLLSRIVSRICLAFRYWM